MLSENAPIYKGHNVITHTVKAYDEQLQKLHNTLIAMGDDVRQLLGLVDQTLSGFQAGNLTTPKEQAYEINIALSKLEHQAEQQATAIIALRQPAGDDLRYVIATFRISSDLARMGELACNALKRLSKVEGQPSEKALKRLLKMSGTAQEMTAAVLKNLSTISIEDAESVEEKEEKMDKHYRKLYARIQEEMAENAELVPAGTNLVFAGKNLERISDYAENVAKILQYVITGAREDDE